MDFTESGMALRETMTALLDFQESNRLLAGKVSALDLHYEPDAEPPPHILNGKRLPDIELTLHDGRPARLYDFLHKGAFVLLSLRGSIPAGIDTDSVAAVRAELAETRADWDDVHTVLIRPDGHAAWRPAAWDVKRKKLFWPVWRDGDSSDTLLCACVIVSCVTKRYSKRNNQYGRVIQQLDRRQPDHAKHMILEGLTDIFHEQERCQEDIRASLAGRMDELREENGKKLQLTLTEIHILSCIGDHEPINVTSIAEK